jgi:hypothetical protein
MKKAILEILINKPRKEYGARKRQLRRNKPEPTPRDVLENILNGFHCIFN